MIKVDQFMDVKLLQQQGHSIRDIARLTGLSRNTVRKVLRGEHDLKFQAPARHSCLEPFHEYLQKRYADIASRPSVYSPRFSRWATPVRW